MDAICPRSRTEQLLIEELDDELLVYDLDADKAHRLNHTAAAVFRNADGERSVADLVDVVGPTVGELVDEDLILITLDNLAEARLIEDYESRASRDARLSRRRFIRRAGTVAAAAMVLPIVHSIVAPSAQAQSSPPEECPPFYYEDPETGNCIYYGEPPEGGGGARKLR